jgi:hypothetical protein
MEIAAMKQASMDTQNLLRNKDNTNPNNELSQNFSAFHSDD